MADTMTNCGKWSENMAVRFPETEYGLRIMEKISSISALELLLTLVGCRMCGKNKEIIESRKSLVGA